MKRYTALLLTAALLCTGCVSVRVNNSGADNIDNANHADNTSTTDSALTDVSAEAAIDITLEQETSDMYATIETEETTSHTSFSFKPGTWRGSSQYYFFNEDGASGTTQSFSLGIGVGFQYEIDGKNVMFHFGASDDNSPAAASDISEDSVSLKWDNGNSETLVFVSAEGADSFVFYTDEQIGEIALRYYQENNDGYVPGSVGLKSNDDGTVTIQLYDNMTDHNSTSAWYTIDRVTLKGTDDIALTEVDMSGYAG